MNLKYIDCESNRLTKLNVNRNAKLDVSLNTVLKDLTCAYNQLTNLDVSKNQLLVELWCAGNKIKELNLKKNKQLYRLVYDKKVKVRGLSSIEIKMSRV